MTVYFNGKFINKKDVAISPDDRGFLFGDGIYEVMRIYKGKIFQADDHFNRLNRNLDELLIRNISVDHLRQASEELIELNKMENEELSLYIQITRGVAPRTHAFPKQETEPTVYIAVTPANPPKDEWTTGVKIILLPDLRWARCDIKSISLLPNILAKQQADDAGAHEAVFVKDGYITEGSHTSVAAIINGEFVTHPQDQEILIGTTRKLILALCSELKIPLREEAISEKEFYDADEIILLGTTTEIMPVVKVDDRIISNGKPGPVTIRLQQALKRKIDHFIKMVK